MDVWINFTNATKWQAEGIFKCFFPSKSSEPLDKSATEAQDRIAQSKRKESARVVPLLEEVEINELAKRFAENVPEGELSVRASLGSRIWNTRNKLLIRLRVFKGIFSGTRLVRASALSLSCHLCEELFLLL